MRTRSASRRRPADASPARDRYALYEASVQGVEYDLDLMERAYRRHHGRRFTHFREDFCGTAAMAAAWAARRPANHAWGVDLDPEPLRWARAHRLRRMGAISDRVTLLRRDVRAVTRPRVDVIAALNFSYWVFETRAALRDYFARARRALRPGGLLIVNAFGGTEAMGVLTERRRIAASQTVDGTRLPGFTYEWEHESFNIVDHHIRCHIHFRFADGSAMRKAFTYEWRFWSLPEIQEVMREAGFGATEVMVEGWDDEAGKADGTYLVRRFFENQEGWLAFVIGER